MSAAIKTNKANKSERQLEAEIQDAIRLELGDVRRYPDLVIWRNNVGVLPDSHGGFVRFGLAPGSADLVGIFTDARGIGRFVSAEIKTPQGRQSDEQQQWERLVTSKGGIYAVLRSVEDAREWVRTLRSNANG